MSVARAPLRSIAGATRHPRVRQPAASRVEGVALPTRRRTAAAAPRLDKDSGAPAFLQLKQLLRDGILGGAIGGRLPSERELARTHGIAYMTARRAIDALVDERLVHRVPGVGTFICRTGGPIARSGNIGVVLSASIRHGLANPYYGPVASGVLAGAREAGVSAFVCTTSDELLPNRDDAASRRKVDGLVALGRPDRGGLEALASAAGFVPVVAVNSAPVREGMPSLRCDDRGAGAIAAAHLLQRGHRRIAWIGCAGAITAEERFAGFAAALAEGGAAVATPLIRQGDFEIESGEGLARELLSAASPPTAIACANDAMACGVLRTASRLGLAVPRDLAVLGFDDLLLGSYLPQPLTSVGADAVDYGRTAAGLLFAMLDGRQPPEVTLVPCRLNARATT